MITLLATHCQYRQQEEHVQMKVTHKTLREVYYYGLQQYICHVRK